MLRISILSEKELEKFFEGKFLSAKQTDLVTLVGSHTHSDYMTTSKSEDGSGYIACSKEATFTGSYSTGATGVSYRPAIKFDSIHDIIKSGGFIYFDKYGLKVKLGKFVQNAPSMNKYKKIQKKFKKWKYIITGNQFTLSQRNWFHGTPFCKTRILYEPSLTKKNECKIGKDRYVVVNANFVYQTNRFKLSNGAECSINEEVFLKIEPIVWRVSLKYKTMISESILIPGIPINEIDGYLKSTFIKETRIIN